MPLDHYVTLGRSGLRVSPFALGAMTFGTDPPGAGCSVEESGKILGDFFAAHQGRRQHVVPASKFFGNLFPGDPNGGGAVGGAVGGPGEEEYAVIDAVAAVADEPGTTSAAVSLAWLRAREGTVVPIVGARRVDHLRDNLAGLEVPFTPAHLRTLDDVLGSGAWLPGPDARRAGGDAAVRRRHGRRRDVGGVPAAGAERRSLLSSPRRQTPGQTPGRCSGLTEPRRRPRS